MVHEQGDTVNSIEANVDHATISVHDGADQLRQAEIYKVSNNGIYFLTYAHFIYLVSFQFFNFVQFSFNVISEQGEKEKTMSRSVWNCSTGNYHRNNSLGCQKVDRHEN